jgi:hypothetical protein
MKICLVENCNYPVFGKGLCRNHQFLRKDKKHRPIPIHTKKKAVHEVSFGFDSQLEIFQYLWQNAQDENGNVFCKYTGRRLNGIYHSTFCLSVFAHILSKKNYPYFKLNPENVAVVSPDFHTVIDQGCASDRAKHPDWKWDEWDAKVIEMKAEYQKFKNENLLS